MKKIITLIVLQFAAYWCMAQVTIQPLLPQVGLFQKSQLWNMLVINSSATTYNCYIVLSLQDRESGVEVLSATSAAFTLGKEAKQLNTAILTPIQYNFSSFTGNKTDDFLPVGSYTACYKLVLNGEIAAELSEACLPFDVAPLSPPMLIIPADSSVLQAPPTQFTWQAPAPLMMFQQLHYEMVIAEILPGQKPEEAIELNAPFYMDLNVQSSFLNYTGAYPSFETGKWYAWQIVAQDGDSYAAKTPVWDFTVSSQPLPELHPVNGIYILLKDSKEGAGGVNTITGSVLGIKYYSFEKEHTASMKFIGADGKTIKEVTENVTYGDNFIGYQLDKSFKKGITYSVEITDSKNNKSVAFFVIK